MIWVSAEKTRFGHISETFIKSWQMLAKTTSRIPEESATNLSLLLVKNKIEQRIVQTSRQLALAFFLCFGEKIVQVRL